VKQEPAEEQWPLPAGWRAEGEGRLSPQGQAFPTRVAAAEWGLGGPPRRQQGGV
jgi:hypothetical protein